MSTVKQNQQVEPEVVPSSPSQQQQHHRQQQPTSRPHSRSGSVSNTSNRTNTHSRTNSGSMPRPANRVAEPGGYATTTTDDDDSVIRCICNFEHDDGFTIQCERCLVWQHAVCVGIDQDSVPDEYLCERCAPRELDVKKAVEKQKRGGGGGMRDKEKETPSRRSRGSPKRRQNSKSGGSRKGSTIAGNGQSPTRAFPWDLTSGGSASGGAAPKEQRDFTSSGGAGGGGNGINGGKKVYGKSRKQPHQLQYKRRLSGTQSTQFHTLMNGLDDENWGDEDDEYDDEETPAYELEFSSIGRNIIAAGQVHDLFRRVSAHVRNKSDAAKPSSSSITGINPEDFEKARTSSPSDMDVDEGAGKLDVDLESLVPIAYNWLQRPSARISVRRVTKTSLHTHSTHFASEDTSSPLESTHAGSRYGLFAESNIEADRFILELKGEQILKSSYIRDPINQYALLGTPKPHVFFASGSLDLCIDARRFGNVARFVRNSCHPNAEIRGMYVSTICEDDEDSEDDRDDRDDEFGSLPTVHLGLYTKREVARGEEITIAWDWASGHPALETEPTEADSFPRGSDEDVSSERMDDDDSESKTKESIFSQRKKDWTRRRSRAVKPILAVSSCACGSLWSGQCNIRRMACGDDDEFHHDFATGRRISTTNEQGNKKKRPGNRTSLAPKSQLGTGKGPPETNDSVSVKEEEKFSGVTTTSVAETAFARRRRSSTGSQLGSSRIKTQRSSDMESGDEEVDGGILGDDNVSENDAKPGTKRGGTKNRRRRTRRVTTGGMDKMASESEHEEGSDRENGKTGTARGEEEEEEGRGGGGTTKQSTEPRRPSKSRYAGGRVGAKELDSIVMAPPPAPPPPPPPPPPHTSPEEPNRPLSREERKLKETLARIAKMEEREESGRKKDAKKAVVRTGGGGKSAKTKDSKENDHEKEGTRRGRVRSSDSRIEFADDNVKTEGKPTPRRRKDTFDRRRREEEGSEEDGEEEEEEKDADEEMEDAEREEDERVGGRRRQRVVSGASSTVGKRNERKKGVGSPTGKNPKTSIAGERGRGSPTGAGGTLSSSSLSSVSGMSSSEDDEEPGGDNEDEDLDKADDRRTGKRREAQKVGTTTTTTRNPRNRKTSGEVGRKQGTAKRKRTFSSPLEGDDSKGNDTDRIGKKGDESSSNNRRTRRPSLRNLSTRTRTKSSPASAPTSTPVSTPGSSSAGEDDEGNNKKSTTKSNRQVSTRGGGTNKSRSSNNRSNVRSSVKPSVQLHGGKKFWQRKWMTTRSPSSLANDAAASVVVIEEGGGESRISSYLGNKRALDGGGENGSAMISGRKKAKLGDDESEVPKREKPEPTAEPRRLSLRDYQVEKGLLPVKGTTGTGLLKILEEMQVTDATTVQRTASTVNNTPEKEILQGISESARTTPDNEKPRKLTLSDYRKQKQLEAAAKKESESTADAAARRTTTGLDCVLPEPSRNFVPKVPSPREKGDDNTIKPEAEYFPMVSLPDHLLSTHIGKEMAYSPSASTFEASASGKHSEDYFPVLPMSSLRTGSEGRVRGDDDRNRGGLGKIFKAKEGGGKELHIRDRDRDGRERDRTGRDAREREPDASRGGWENKDHGNIMTPSPTTPLTSPQPPRGPSSGFPFVPSGGAQQQVIGARNGLVRNIRRYASESGTCSPPPKGPAVSAPYDPANPDGGDIRRSPPTPTGPAADRERERERDRDRDRDMGGIRDIGRDRSFGTSDRFSDRPPPFGTSRSSSSLNNNTNNNSSSNNGSGPVGTYKHPLDSTMPSYYGGPSYRDRRDYGYPSPREGYDMDTGRYPPRKNNLYASSPLSAAPSNIPFQGTASSGRVGGGGTNSYNNNNNNNNGSASGSGGLHGGEGGGRGGVERRFNDDEDSNGIPTGPRKPRFYTPPLLPNNNNNSSSSTSSSSLSSAAMGPGFGQSGTGNGSSSTAGRSDTGASGSANGGKMDDYSRRDRR